MRLEAALTQGAFYRSIFDLFWTIANLDPFYTRRNLIPSLPMAAETFGIVAGAAGLAANVFHTAKKIRDTIHLVSSCALILARSWCSVACTRRR
jgi:hypothetical protein